MFFYGITLEYFNHYLVWPRVFAISLILIIIYEIWNDRRDKMSLFVFCTVTLLFIGSILFGLSPFRTIFHISGISHILVVLSTLLLVQGTWHQVLKIRRSRTTGALSLQMHQLFALKDIFSLLFGLAIGLKYGWPIILMHFISLIVQLVTMYHFHWVKTVSKN
ncbi:MAG: Unknown protein [uncultured Campylobacterales bacterium]|uniref:Uncharacterized protein n=1 Tax=uncultured Campylobacterales bacterium TaxID=352960 RepID=A0A6S6SJK3_9BACT|nr:MAG: Unknown protein [uncultured Campylobacterales bacterium]